MTASTIDVHEEVIEELKFDPSVDDAAIAVAVADGVVTMTGSVPSYAQKLAAERAVKRVRGVRGLVETLKVELPKPHVRSDVDIVNAALDALQWNLTVPLDAVKVTMENGWVKLTGALDWQFQREAAEHSVASVAGVRGISNDTTLKRHVVAGDIREQIRNSFRRSSALDADRIAVEIAGDTVTLSGAVHSWNEREDATSAAYSIAGVRRVENRTTVS